MTRGRAGDLRQLALLPTGDPPCSVTATGDRANRLPNDGLALANVLYAKKGSIAYVTVNRPKVLNALNTPTWSDLRTAFKDARDDAAMRGVILTGAGDKAFIAGADISELAHVTRIRGGASPAASDRRCSI